MQRLDPLIHPNVPPDCRRAFRSTIVIPNPLAIPRADISADRLLPNQKIFESRFESGWRWIGLTQQRSAITRGLFTAIRIASAALCSDGIGHRTQALARASRRLIQRQVHTIPLS